MKKVDKIVLFIVFALLVGIIILIAIMYEQKRIIVYENIIKEEKVASENIVFLGDSITAFYDLDSYYDDVYHVQSGHDGDKTYQVLDNMYERVYRYNPSKVFIMLGINNFVYDDTDVDAVVSDIKEICEKIKDRNKYTEIYIEYIYPYSDEWQKCCDGKAKGTEEVNTKIDEANKLLKAYAKEKDYKYINVHDALLNEDGELEMKYSKDGLHPNDEGYKIITEKLIKYMK